MARLQDGAENTTKELMLLESQLAEIGVTKKGQAKSALLMVASGRDKALKSSVLSSWQSVIGEMRIENEIRQKFESRIQSAERKLMQFKAKQCANVRSVMKRLAGEEDKGALRDVWSLWVEEVQIQKAAMGENAEELNRVKALLADLQEATVQSARKVMARLAGNNANALARLHFQGWVEHGRLFKQEKELENAVNKTKMQLKNQLDEKKSKARAVLEKLTGATASGLKGMMFQHWVEYVHQERDALAMQKALGCQEQFRKLTRGHRDRAKNVQMRVNEQMALNLKQQVFATWALETKVNGINHAFSNKYTSKKRQLQGVQNLFKSFAMQLEQNLGGDKQFFPKQIYL
jgi:hypothetical protein